MDKNLHLIIAIFFFVTLMLLFKDVTISLIIIPIFMTIASDVDRGKNHRFFVFHSLLIPLFVLIFNMSLLAILIVLAFGLHLICDIRFTRKKMTGTYTICIIPSFTINFKIFKFSTKEVRLNGILSTMWMVLNFVLSIIIFVTYMVIVL